MDGNFLPAADSATSISDALIEVTLITSEHPLTKTYRVGHDGKPEKASDPFLSAGNAERIYLRPDDFADEFAVLLGCITQKQALVLGSMSEEIVGPRADLTTKDRYKPELPGEGSPLIWRGKQWLGYRDGDPAVLGLDYDSKDVPAEIAARLLAEGGLLAVLETVCPALKGAARVVRPSVSTGITVTASGDTTKGGGLHIYLPVANGGDAAAFVNRLHQHLILAGWGFPFVSAAGSVQVRSLVDMAASGIGERLWFEAPTVLGAGLEHIAQARAPESFRGRVLDTEGALPPLTADEQSKLRVINVALRDSVASAAASKRQQHVVHIREQMTQRGEDATSAAEVVARLSDADTRGVLNGRHLLHMDDGSIVSVGDVLADRSDYHKKTCADPLEPSYGGGTNKAVIFTDGRRPRLFSHAHGGRLYTLAYDEADLITALNAEKDEGGKQDQVLRKLAPDIVFGSGGWRQVEAETGVCAADLLGFGDVELPEPAMLSVSPVQATGLVPFAPTIVAQDATLICESLDPDATVDALMRDFNKRFAVVGEGGSAGIVRLAYNPELNLRSPTTMTQDAFRLLYGNRFISMPRKSRNGEVEYQKVPATTVWLKHEARRTCPDGFGLDPTGNLPSTCFNLWQGFGVEEKEGDWSKLAAMIFEVLADGNEEHFNYIIHWLAHLVQRPHENPGVALVFRGPQGVGKGTLGRAIMCLMRPHAMQITHTKHLTGPFNAHMRSVLFLFADEAFFAGDKANEGALKGLITEEFRVNEAKGRDATLRRNRLHLMMASNNDWVIPASADARRYAVFNVSDIHKQDLNYFSLINAEMDVDGAAAGIAAMAYDLRRIPLDMDLIRKAPETTGLQSQRIESLRGPARWLFDVMMSGYVGEYSSESWQEYYQTEVLFGSYQRWSKENKEAYPAQRNAFGTFLASMFSPHRPRSIPVAGIKARSSGYRLGTLEAARKVFGDKQGLGSPWPVEDEGEMVSKGV